jgi:hypothetical protein
MRPLAGGFRPKTGGYRGIRSIRNARDFTT